MIPSAALAMLLACSSGCDVGAFALDGPASANPDGPGSSGAGGGDPGANEPQLTLCEGNSQAHDTFNAFWQTLDSSYAVFDVRLTDTSWAAIGSDACSMDTDGMTDTALYDLLLHMAERLDDGHTNQGASSLGRDEDAWVSEYPYYEQLYTLEGNVETQYLDGDLTYGAEDEISWGLIGNVAYLSITSMDALSPSEDEDDDRAAANQAMAAAMAAVGGAQAMIVDIRANEGGWDTVSLDIASWVAGSRTVAWTEQVRSGPAHDDFGAPEAVYVEATRQGGFTGPVVLLTRGGTFSAAETFALAMRVRNNVTIVGERTSGHLSDTIDGSLPNGWTFTYSGERYIAADGQLYEVQGIPVDQPVALDVAALAAGRDVMLEQALAALGQ